MDKQKKLIQMIDTIEMVLVGKRDVIEKVVITLLAKGHVLLEDVPGVGKTTLAKTLAKTMDSGFTRIQFTPDSLPSDITGLSIYNMKTGQFEIIKGAIMNNIILADEINRTSPKTQASLLEAMEEGQVTIDGITNELPKPFMVIATQNPIDYLGTYHLPEAQLDRFMMKLSIGYPGGSDEGVMVERFLQKDWKENIAVVMNEEDIRMMQEEVEKIKVSQDMILYITKIVQETRKDPNIVLGASPRATLAMVRAIQAMAYLHGREYCIPDDVIELIHPMLGHRMILSPDAKLSQMTIEKVLKNILARVPMPIFSK